MVRRPALVLTLLVAACTASPSHKVASVSSGFGDVPLPADTKIVPPGPDVPAQLAAFSGKWEGVWGKDRPYPLDGVLVVEKVEPNGAEVIYAWGASPRYFQADWMRTHATFEGNSLVIDTPHIHEVYKPLPNGTLDAIYRNKTNSLSGAEAIMKKVP